MSLSVPQVSVIPSLQGTAGIRYIQYTSSDYTLINSRTGQTPQIIDTYKVNVAIGKPIINGAPGIPWLIDLGSEYELIAIMLNPITPPAGTTVKCMRSDGTIVSTRALEGVTLDLRSASSAFTLPIVPQTGIYFTNSVRARYIRLENPGPGFGLDAGPVVLSASQIEAYDILNRNVATAKATRTLTTAAQGVPAALVDGMATSTYRGSSGLPGDWWEVDLGKEYSLWKFVYTPVATSPMNTSIVLYNSQRQEKARKFSGSSRQPQAVLLPVEQTTTQVQAQLPAELAQVPGLTLWLDATDPNANGEQPLDGSELLVWKDKSPFTNDATTITNANVVYTTTGIKFSGPGGMSLPTNTFIRGTNSFSLFFVFKPANPAAYSGTLFSRYDNNDGTGKSMRSYLTFGGITNIDIQTMHVANANYNANGPMPFNITFGNPVVLCIIYNSSTQVLQSYINGIPFISYTITTISPWGSGVEYIGQLWNAAAPFNGNIQEIIGYNTVALNQSQQEAIENYLMKKWSLGSRSRIPGMTLWLDATDVNANGIQPANGSQMTTWKDKSGANNHANTLPGAIVKYSSIVIGKRLTAVQFIPDGIKGGMQLPNSTFVNTNNSFTLFVVYTSATPGRWAQNILSSDAGWIPGSTNNSLRVYSEWFSRKIGVLPWYGTNVSGEMQTNPDNIINTSYTTLISIVYSNTTRKLQLYTNGKTDVSYTYPVVNTWSPLYQYIGSIAGYVNDGYWNGGTWVPPNYTRMPVGPLNGNIHEIIGYNTTALSDPARQYIEQNLMKKWSNTSDWSRIPGMSLWLDATDVNGNGIQPTNGSQLTTWKDKSGSNNHANTHTGAIVKYSAMVIGKRLTGVQFVPSGNWGGMQLPDSTFVNTNNSFTLFVVYTSGLPGTWAGSIVSSDLGVIPGSTTNSFVLISERNSRKIAPIPYYGTTYNWMETNPDSISNTSYTTLISIVYSNATRKFQVYINGKIDVAYTYPVVNTWSPLFQYIGAAVGYQYDGYWNGGTWVPPNYARRPIEPLNGNIHEIIGYNTTALSDPERQSVEQHLMKKWSNTSDWSRIPGMSLWLDASDINGNGVQPADGSQLATWKDKSGSNNHANTHAGAIVKYTAIVIGKKHAGVQFVPSGSWGGMQLPDRTFVNTNNSFTLFVVYTSATPGTWAGSIVSSDLGVIPGMSTNSFVLVSERNSRKIAPITFYGVTRNFMETNPDSIINTSYTTLISIVYNNATRKFQVYINGKIDVAYTYPVVNTWSPLYQYIGATVGYQSDGYYNFGMWVPPNYARRPIEPLNGNIHEIIGYNTTALSDPERQSVEEYLMKKWSSSNITLGIAETAAATAATAAAAAAAAAEAAAAEVRKKEMMQDMTLWLDASDINGNGVQPADGSQLATWKDKSGSNNHANTQTNAIVKYTAIVRGSATGGVKFVPSGVSHTTGIYGGMTLPDATFHTLKSTITNTYSAFSGFRSLTTLSNNPFTLFIVYTSATPGKWAGSIVSSGTTGNVDYRESILLPPQIVGYSGLVRIGDIYRVTFIETVQRTALRVNSDSKSIRIVSERPASVTQTTNSTRALYPTLISIVYTGTTDKFEVYIDGKFDIAFTAREDGGRNQDIAQFTDKNHYIGQGIEYYLHDYPWRRVNYPEINGPSAAVHYQPFNGTIYEIIGYNKTALSDTRRQSVEDYLMKKWTSSKLTTTSSGSTVRYIKLQSTASTLSFNQIVAIDTRGLNVAAGKVSHGLSYNTTTMTTTLDTTPTDGKSYYYTAVNGQFDSRYASSVSGSGLAPIYWWLDLGKAYSLQSIIFYNDMTNTTTASNALNYRLEIFSENHDRFYTAPALTSSYKQILDLRPEKIGPAIDYSPVIGLGIKARYITLARSTRGSIAQLAAIDSLGRNVALNKYNQATNGSLMPTRSSVATDPRTTIDAPGLTIDLGEEHEIVHVIAYGLQTTALIQPTQDRNISFDRNLTNTNCVLKDGVGKIVGIQPIVNFQVDLSGIVLDYTGTQSTFDSTASTSSVSLETSGGPLTVQGSGPAAYAFSTDEFIMPNTFALTMQLDLTLGTSGNGSIGLTANKTTNYTIAPWANQYVFVVNGLTAQAKVAGNTLGSPVAITATSILQIIYDGVLMNFVADGVVIASSAYAIYTAYVPLCFGAYFGTWTSNMKITVFNTKPATADIIAAANDLAQITYVAAEEAAASCNRVHANILALQSTARGTYNVANKNVTVDIPAYISTMQGHYASKSADEIIMLRYSTIFGNIVNNTVTINTETDRTRNFLINISDRLGSIGNRRGNPEIELGWTGNDQAALHHQFIVAVGGTLGLRHWVFDQIHYNMTGFIRNNAAGIPIEVQAPADYTYSTIKTYPSSVPTSIEIPVRDTLNACIDKVNANYNGINTSIGTSQTLLTTTRTVLATVLTATNSIDTYITTNAVPLKNTVDTTTLMVSKEFDQLIAQKGYLTMRNSLSTLQGTEISLKNVLAVLNGTAYIGTVISNAATVATNTNTICNILGADAGCRNTTNSVNALVADVINQKTIASNAISNSGVLETYRIIAGLYNKIRNVVQGRLIGNTDGRCGCNQGGGMAVLAKPDAA
jgi:hypothetical protein